MEFYRGRIAFYGSTRAYWPVFEQHGLEELGQKLNYMSKNNQWEKMPAQISDDTLQLFAAIGRHDQIVNEMKQHFGDMVDAIADSASYDTPGYLPPDVILDIQSLKTPFSGFEPILSPE